MFLLDSQLTDAILLDDIMKKEDNMGNPWALTEWQKEIDSYLIGTTRLYGFVTPKQFLLVFNRYHEQKLLKSELMKYANSCSA